MKFSAGSFSTISISTFSRVLSDSATAIRVGVFLFGKLSLVVGVWFCYLAGVTWTSGWTAASGLGDNDIQPVTANAAVKRSPAEYEVISKRNLFQQQKTDTTSNTAPPPTQLKLKLVGTTITDGVSPYAMIEDLNKHQEDVFSLNDQVFGQAKLIEVHPDHVKLDHHGKVETLRLDEKAPASGGGTSESTEISDDTTDFVVSEQEVSDALANLPLLLSQARAVPYFKDGQSIGMRLFAIRRGSLYEKVGLKNGDIIKVINNTNITDPAQAIKLFEELKNERSIAVKVERGGADKVLNYTVR